MLKADLGQIRIKLDFVATVQQWVVIETENYRRKVINDQAQPQLGR
jgi:hypothetical protein